MAVVENLWRQETPGTENWDASVRPGSANKYFMVSCDTHMNEPIDVWAKRLPKDIAERLPRVEVDEDGQRWMVAPGMSRVRLVFHEDEGDDEDKQRVKAARSPDGIVSDMDIDGVDLQIAFPNKGLMAFAVGIPEVMYPMASVFNDWLSSDFHSVRDRVIPMAVVPTIDVDMAVAEIERIAKFDFFRGVLIPNRPVYGPPTLGKPNYNQPAYDRLWAAIQDHDLAITFHVSTGMDPFHARGPGSAIINYAAWSHPSTIEPVAHMCASGLLDRFTGLRFATIEAGIGYLGWTLEALDEAHKKHYMWTRPRLSRLPSEYFYEHGFAAFQEDPAGLQLIDPRLGETKYSPLENCYLWANDYPHHEGSWPHSAPAIERQMGHLSEAQRVKILGGNAIRCFKLQDLADKRLAAGGVANPAA